MALKISSRADLLLNKQTITPQLILTIDGLDEIFGTSPIFKFPRFDDGLFFDQPELFFDLGTPDENSRDWISDQKTTRNMTQQIEITKGGTSSVTSMDIHLIDKSASITKLFKRDSVITDILGRRAVVYFNFGKDGTHPNDSIKLIDGVISNTSGGAGSWLLTVDHPQQLKRQEIFQKATVKMSALMTDVDTVISLENTTQFLNPIDVLTTYIQVEDEIIQYTGKTSTQLTGLVRAQFGTTAVPHNITEVNTKYRLQDSMIRLALKVLMSGSGFSESENITGIEKLGTLTVDNAVFFTGVDIAKKYGIVSGDTFTITGATNGANNTSGLLNTISLSDSGSYIVTDQPLVLEEFTSASITFKSQFDVLTSGCSMNSQQVDVEQHLFWEDLFSNSFLDYDFLLDDTIKADDFLSNEIYFPQGAYSVPRQGKVSMNMTTPSLGVFDIKSIDTSNIKNPSKISVKRSVNKYFHNSIVYKYDPDEVETDKFRAGIIFISAESQAKIKVGNKPLNIESQGLRANGLTDSLLIIQSRRLLERYKEGATSLKVEVNFKTGFLIEVGDAVIFDSSNLELPDVVTGNRKGFAKIYEVINKEVGLLNGSCVLEILDSSFALDGRYCVVSPSSIIGNGSTVSDIVLTKSFNTSVDKFDYQKWSDKLGQRITIHNEDWTISETVAIQSVFQSNQGIIRVTPNLSFVPTSGMIVDIPNYLDTINTDTKHKAVYGYLCPFILIASGASNTVFDVVDASQLFIGAIIEVHNADYTLSKESKIIDITGLTITVDDDLGFTPSASESIDLVGFLDEGLPYRIF